MEKRKLEFQEADQVLLNMIKTREYDIEEMRNRIEAIEDLEKPFRDGQFTNTYLMCAVENICYDAVYLLLENGADSNNYNEDEYINYCALWELRFLFEYLEEITEVKAEKDVKPIIDIARIMFEHGGNPNLKTDVDPESLYDEVLRDMFNDERDPVPDFEAYYYKELAKILVFYGGGGTGYPKPDIVTPLDISKMDDCYVGSKYRPEKEHDWWGIFGSDGTIYAWF